MHFFPKMFSHFFRNRGFPHPIRLLPKSLDIGSREDIYRISRVAEGGGGITFQSWDTRHFHFPIHQYFNDEPVKIRFFVQFPGSSGPEGRHGSRLRHEDTEEGRHGGKSKKIRKI